MRLIIKSVLKSSASRLLFFSPSNKEPNLVTNSSSWDWILSKFLYRKMNERIGRRKVIAVNIIARIVEK